MILTLLDNLVVLALLTLGLLVAVGSALFFAFWYIQFVTLPWLKGYTARRKRAKMTKSMKYVN